MIKINVVSSKEKPFLLSQHGQTFKARRKYFACGYVRPLAYSVSGGGYFQSNETTKNADLYRTNEI